MNYDLVNLITDSGYIIIPFTRLSAFFIAAPIFALSAFNLQLKILFALATTLLIWDPLMVPPTLELYSLVKILIFEAGLGAGLGLSLQAVSAGVAVAGQALSNSMGLGMANLVDPSLGNSPVLAQFLVILSNFIFLAIDGHVLVIDLLATSFTSIPIGFSIVTFDFYGALLSVTGLIFVAGLAISLPLLLMILVINIALGVTTRSAPSLNVISIGFPFILLVGMVGLLVALPTIVSTIVGVWQTVLEFIVF